MVTPADYRVLVFPDGMRILAGTTEEANALERAQCYKHRYDYPRDFGCPECDKEVFGDTHYLPDAQELNAVLVAQSSRKQIQRWQRVQEWTACAFLCTGIGLAILGATLMWWRALP